MAFPSLFTGLPSFGEDVRSQDRADRNQTNNEKRGRKRKTQTEQPESYNKRRCYQPKTNTAFDASKDSNTRAKFYQKPDSKSRHKHGNQNKEMINDHAHKSGSTNRLHKGQKNQTRSNSSVNKQQHQGKRREKNQQQHKNKGRPADKDRSRQEIRMKTRFMSDEFKEQNGVLVDGQLLCRHFIWGRCIKAEDCQLKHLQPYNDMIKEVCKFYIQGFCTKGESCPYMHKSFPCKFFHRKGKCTQDTDCRFSHEPLNEVTERLLNEAIKRENDLKELVKAKEKLSVQPVNSEESEITEANRNHDEILQPLRTSFYHSTDAERASSVHQTAELAENKEHGSDTAQPDSPPSTDCANVEPVLYSVEAVLGHQQSRPFPSFFTTPGSQETKSVSAAPEEASDSALGSVNQSEVPYSVDAVLRSYKPISQTSSPPRAQTVSYTSKISLQNQNKNVSLNITSEADLHKKKTYQSLPSLQGHPSLVSKTYPDVFLASEDNKNQGEDVRRCQKDAQITSHEDKLGLLNSPVTEAEKSASSPPKHPTELKPNLSGPASHTESFRKPFSPSLGSKDFKGTAAPVTSSIMTRRSPNAAVHHFAVKQLTEIHLNPKRGRLTLKPSTPERNSAKIPPQCPNKMSKGGHFSVGCNKTQARTVKPASDYVTAPACPQACITSQQPADVTDKTSASSFLGLFAAPLGEIPASFPCLPSQTVHSSTPSCSQQSVTDTNLKQRASGLETSVQLWARTDAKQTSHSSASLKFSCKNENDPGKQGMTPVCRLVSDYPSDPSISGTQQQLPDVSSPRDSAAETSSDSVLKTLFLSLKPYKDKKEQQNRSESSVCSEGEKDNTACGLLKQQQESRRKNRLQKNSDSTTLTCYKQSTEKTNENAKDSADQQPSFQASSKAAGLLGINQRDLTKSPARISGTHSFPFKAETPVTKHHTQLTVNPTSKDGGKMAATPFNDLFKPLDMSVFSSGR
ncbi:uncharacterized protein LOC121629216 [Melanotaenia boesemani]|uniref:uncharacterized protein LOC121629216 n=1 Tax=Melanotaenia boesemani TaxID=1250792 RepID=UPI001C049C2F|nr:uncharacterized protein LOC121629216 [Melanotaenia boesemani]